MLDISTERSTTRSKTFTNHDYNCDNLGNNWFNINFGIDYPFFTWDIQRRANKLLKA